MTAEMVQLSSLLSLLWQAMRLPYNGCVPQVSSCGCRASAPLATLPAGAAVYERRLPEQVRVGVFGDRHGGRMFHPALYRDRIEISPALFDFSNDAESVVF